MFVSIFILLIPLLIFSGGFDIVSILPQLQKEIPSLPITYYFHRIQKLPQNNKDCAKFPIIQMLNFYNTYWQTYYSGQIIYHLYGAYYDTRLPDGPIVRILVMSNNTYGEFSKNYCQLWFGDDNRMVLSEIYEYKMIWQNYWGITPFVYYPYLMSCKVPKNMNITGDLIPKAVSLVERECDKANNVLRVIYDKPEDQGEKQQFAVCVKGLDYPKEDFSERLVEWLEMLKLLGVHKVYMYELQVHPNISKVLDYYQRKGFIEVQKTSLVGGVVGVPDLEHWLMKTYHLNKRLNELIPYNDCFYRNLYKYDYIALLDIDEIIMPQGDLKNWKDLLATIIPFKETTHCPLGLFNLCARNVYYPAEFEQQVVPTDSYPNYMHMLNHGYRFLNFTKPLHNIKCFHSTQTVISVHNHLAISYFNKSCAYNFPTNYAQMQHYRNVVPKKEEIFGGLIWDNNIERFKDPLLERCTKVLQELKLIS